MRFACAFLPDLPLAAALRVEPELCDKPVAIVLEGSIVAGHLRGQSVSEARTACVGLICRALSLEAVQTAQAALCDVALSIAPRVESREGKVFVDLVGTEALFPSPRGVLTALRSRLERAGLGCARVGIGPTRTVAELAARHARGGAIVSAEREAAFLEPLALDLLDVPDALAERLLRWGIRKLGELARLPRDALGTRLGEAGVRLADRARGLDREPFRPIAPPLRFVESAESDFPIDNLETLAFVLRGALERLTERLALRALAARELELELALEGGGRVRLAVPLAAPTREPMVLLSLVRLALERTPPPAPVERLTIAAAPGALESAQLDLFLPPLPSPGELAVTVARLEALCGSGRVGAPGVEDTHLPDAARLDQFVLRPKQSTSRKATLPRNALALRALRPPRPVRVVADSDAPLPRALSGGGGERGGFVRVQAAAGPWRLFGEWWGDHPFARDYFDVELEDGRVCRLYHDLESDGWFVDGTYD